MEKITVPMIRARKGGERITMLTAYDFPFAQLVDAAGMEIILVGDSVGNAVLGYPNTLPVTVEEMIHHTAAVVRGTKRALVVADMPFMSYHESIEQARRNAGRLIKETGAAAVKAEGGVRVRDVIKAIVDIDIPVMAHIGLTPQSVNAMGGFKVQGKGSAEDMLIEDARAVEEAGAFSVVLEGIPRDARQENHGDAFHPDHRHRGRAGLRRPGARHPRPFGSGHRLQAEIRQDIRKPGRTDRKRGEGIYR